MVNFVDTTNENQVFASSQLFEIQDGTGEEKPACRCVPLL